MPERFEIYIVYKRRYVNTLPFLFSLAVVIPSGNLVKIDRISRTTIICDL